MQTAVEGEIVSDDMEKLIGQKTDYHESIFAGIISARLIVRCLRRATAELGGFFPADGNAGVKRNGKV